MHLNLSLEFVVKNILNCRLNDHLQSTEHFKLINIYPESITLNNELFKLCTKCYAYINEYRYKIHTTPECRLIKRKDLRCFKGKIQCVCGLFLKDNSAYISHLPSVEHINKFNSYLQKFDPWD